MPHHPAELQQGAAALWWQPWPGRILPPADVVDPTGRDRWAGPQLQPEVPAPQGSVVYGGV